ncbi:MAG: CPBP family intramembrane metalloprotease, partial [Rickettsia endosymbiont of Ixodes persulcatus]|nr:CPBP family intramembrane metalloprotease [Rickettsia endosymbiont of Ixodes persulcatus]
MLVSTWQYIVAFVMLVVLAPVGEELLFRGYLYGKLRKSAPIWLAVLATSLTFGLAHLWTGGEGPLQWAVAVDTFVLSLVMCSVREYTGAIWITIFMHMAKNGLAFYLLFVNPQFVDQIKAAILPLL